MDIDNCVIYGAVIPLYNITGACKSCFNNYRKKDVFGNWIVTKVK